MAGIDLHFEVTGGNDEPEAWLIVGVIYEQDSENGQIYVDFKDLVCARVGPVPDEDNRHWTHDVRRTIIEHAACICIERAFTP